MAVSELFIYKLENKVNRGFFYAIVHVYAYILPIFEQRIGYAQQIQVNARLVEYRHGNKLLF